VKRGRRATTCSIPPTTFTSVGYQPPAGLVCSSRMVNGIRTTRCSLNLRFFELRPRQTRNPRLWFVFDGWFLLRFDERTFLAELFQLPPRLTRFEHHA